MLQFSKEQIPANIRETLARSLPGCYHVCMQPSYLKLHAQGLLQGRVAQTCEILKECTLCPRACKVNRIAGKLGFCGIGSQARIASYGPHFGEEAPLVGSHGSGTIFFCGCNLLCGFCQNFDISHLRRGEDVTPAQLAAMMLELARYGCHNINLVTPTHVIPQILAALPQAIEQGLRIPLVYNCGGYENISTLKLLDGIIDIYMPDVKFWDNRVARTYCGVSDYRERACAALQEMHHQVGDLIIENSLARKGLLARHLVMPQNMAGTAEIMRFIASKISRNTYVNVMDQYRPCYRAVDDPVIGRRISREEYTTALAQTRSAGLHRINS